MGMTFIEALQHAMRVTEAKSLRDVAMRAGVSYDILKNAKQGKSETPNAVVVAKIADYFGVSVQDFYAGRIQPVSDEEAASIAEDAAKVSDLVRRLRKGSREQVRLFARSLLRTEEELRQGE